MERKLISIEGTVFNDNGDITEEEFLDAFCKFLEDKGWHYERDNKIYEKHLTPKPVDMIKHILDTSSKENDLVYIPFAGSGSDIIACIENNRNYIATEINNEYIEKIIYPRLKNIQ